MVQYVVVKSYNLNLHELDLVIEINKEEEKLLNMRYRWKIEKDPNKAFKIGENHIKGLFVSKHIEKIEQIIQKASSYLSIINLMEYVLVV